MYVWLTAYNEGRALSNERPSHVQCVYSSHCIRFLHTYLKLKDYSVGYLHVCLDDI